MKISLILFLIFTLSLSSLFSEENLKDKKFASKMKLLISFETLEEAGITNFNASSWELLLSTDAWYLKSEKDCMILKIQNNKPVRVYKDKGQGPGSFIFARSMFFINPGTIGVYDVAKNCILFFDRDLKYKNEIKITSSSIRMIRSTGNKLLAYGDFPDKKIFAALDKNFNIIESFISFVPDIPFNLSLPAYIFKTGYLMNDEKLAANTWLFMSKICETYIYDASSKKKCLTLKWEQDHEPSQKDINQRINMYSSLYIGKYGKFYVVETSFAKNIKQIEYNEFLVFNEKGYLIYREKGDMLIINSHGNINDSRLFLLDDEKGLMVLDLQEL